MFVLGCAEPSPVSIVERAGHEAAAVPLLHKDGVFDFEHSMSAVSATFGRPDWIVVDHYELDTRWETRAREEGFRVMAIDDLANRTHDADILLDQNYFRGMEKRYAGILKKDAVRLMGPSYALLRREFARKLGIATAAA